jgi:hypothetical protein
MLRSFVISKDFFATFAKNKIHLSYENNHRFIAILLRTPFGVLPIGAAAGLPEYQAKL